MFSPRRRKYSDCEIISGLQRHDSIIEKYFFDSSLQYFENHFTQFFFDADSKQEVFQKAIVKLWTEIENKTIRVKDNLVCRRQLSGEYREMTASLTTFMMAFAKNEFRELLRNTKADNFDDIVNNTENSNFIEDVFQEDEDEVKIQIIDECILSMSPNCIEIITMFYYKRKTLDEIMAIRGSQNASKDGLKTAKNKCMVTLRKRVAERINSF